MYVCSASLDLNAGKVIISLAVLVGSLLVPYELSQLAGSLFSVEGDIGDQVGSGSSTPARLGDEAAVTCAKCGERGHSADAVYCRICGSKLPVR